MAGRVQFEAIDEQESSLFVVIMHAGESLSISKKEVVVVI
jgi:hypothetical protein